MRQVKAFRILACAASVLLVGYVVVAIWGFQQRDRQYRADVAREARKNVECAMGGYAAFWADILSEFRRCLTPEQSSEIERAIQELRAPNVPNPAGGDHAASIALAEYSMNVLRQEIGLLSYVRQSTTAGNDCESLRQRISDQAVELSIERISQGFLLCLLQSRVVKTGHPLADAVVVKNADRITACADSKLGGAMEYTFHEVFPAQNGLHEICNYYSGPGWKPLEQDLFSPTEKGGLSIGWRTGRNHSQIWSQSWVDTSGNIISVNVVFPDDSRAQANVTLFHFPSETVAGLWRDSTPN
jgi:hypothetical protein